MAQAAAGLQVIGGIVGAVGSLQSGKAAAAAGEYNAQVAERNAQAATDQAAADERQLRISGRKQIGGMRAAIGASGVSLSGSALDILGESAANLELDALNIRHGGQVKSLLYQSDATLDRMGGQNALRQSRYSAASTLLGSAAKTSEYFPSSSGGKSASADTLSGNYAGEPSYNSNLRRA